ncbi:hypothetical protein [Archangium sp.]|uniref:hypothetical protein n=1 Tax=Archangium sp. TaxID=1872627 RepID=UPI002D29A85D|nr:hypothetical protein [Archangium sp.]HYO59556.1 hypothetical protein [Archangium sp.]
MRAPDELILEVDGPDLHPTTIDTRAALDLVESFVRLLDKTAEAHGMGVTLQGLQVVDKCFQAVFKTSTPQEMHVVAAAMERLIGGGKVPPVKGLAEAANKLRTSIRKFGPGHRFKIAMGEWERELDPQESPQGLMPESITTIRARLVRIGVSPPRARFEAGSEVDPFTLSITREQALAYSRFLDQDVDIEISIKRGVLDTIEDGRVLHLYPMDENAGPDAWLNWLTENGRHWNDVEDHLKELGRYDD